MHLAHIGEPQNQAPRRNWDVVHTEDSIGEDIYTPVNTLLADPLLVDTLPADTLLKGSITTALPL